MFKSVPSSPNLIQLEEAVLRTWKNRHIFKKSMSLREHGEAFVFYEAPPAAHAKPELQHVVARAFKDLFLRYKSMNGYRVLRRGGWNTHGLPVEVQVERELGLANKLQIEEFGIERFNQRCRRSVFTYIQEWERLTERIAYWLDLEDAFVTFTNEYIESLWWLLKSLWEKELLYQAFKITPYCPRCGTSLSDHEASLGYRETVDPSIFVRLPLVEEPGTSLLIWSTAPWTLPGDVAVAANPDEDYVIVEREQPEGGRERLILAQAVLKEVFKDQRVEAYESFKGRKLKDLHYKPLFTFLLPDKKSHFVLLGDFVKANQGTGLVHIAPAFNDEDMQTAFEHDLPILQTVTDAGTFIPEVRPWSGKSVRVVDQYIIQDLHDRGLLFKAETYTHTHPFCWSCDTPLITYARNTWYLRTSAHKDQLVTLNRQINWLPKNIKNGHLSAWLEKEVDWALGHERYWGTPLPIWDCTACHHQLAVESRAELARLAGEDLEDLDLHRPYVDQVTLPCPKCEGKMQRVPEVIDAWFDAGAVPLAQWHYPFENRSQFQEHFPADFLCESIDLNRPWFYALHTLGTLALQTLSFKNFLSLGALLDDHGENLSPYREDGVDPWEVINAHGSDALRWHLYTSAPPDQNRRVSTDLVEGAVRGFTLPLWNVYRFFVTHARMNNWRPPSTLTPLSQGLGEGAGGEGLDRWLLSELHALIRDVSKAYENYDVLAATRPVQSFVVERLSGWYLRRSRRRFRQETTPEDKNSAYQTLYTALLTLSKLLAPATPLLAEEMYQNLVVTIDPNAPESAHLNDWPRHDPALIDTNLNPEMQLVMRLASLGHAARQRARLKVRQPLSSAAFSVPTATEREVLERYAGLLVDELNVKQVKILDPDEQVVSFKLNPLPGRLGPKYRSRYPGVREAILKLDPNTAARLLLEGEPIQVAVGDEMLAIQPHEVEVHAQAGPGLAVASDGPYLVVLDTERTPSLIDEGWARGFVRHVQDLRKEAGFDLADRIRVYASATPDLEEALQNQREHILSEARADELSFKSVPEGGIVRQASFEGQEVKFGIEKS